MVRTSSEAIVVPGELFLFTCYLCNTNWLNNSNLSNSIDPIPKLIKIWINIQFEIVQIQI